MLAEAAAAADESCGCASCTVRLSGSSATGVAVRERLAGDLGLAGFQEDQELCPVASGTRDDGSAS